MLRVFVSYPEPDCDDAIRLRRVMLDCSAELGVCVEVFVASESIQVTTVWEAGIAEAITKCDLMVVLWTRNSKLAEWQWLEVGAGWILNKLFLTIPRGTSRAELPPILERYQAVDSWDDFRDAFLQMLDAELKKKDNGA